jgi:hypothetical protein
MPFGAAACFKRLVADARHKMLLRLLADELAKDHREPNS